MRYTVDFYRKLLVLVSAGDIKSSDFQGIANRLPETKGNGGAVKSILPRIERALSGEYRESDKKRTATLSRIRQAHYGLGGCILGPLTGSFNATIENTRSKCFNFEEYTNSYDTDKREYYLQLINREEIYRNQALKIIHDQGLSENTSPHLFSPSGVKSFEAPIKDLREPKTKVHNLFSKIIKYIKSLFY
jgi:hypothetical protein